MRSTLGLLLVLAGGGLMLYGLGSALAELVELYQGSLSRPLEEGARTTDETSRRMLHSALTGGIGAPFFITGVILLKSAMIRRALRSRRRA